MVPHITEGHVQVSIPCTLSMLTTSHTEGHKYIKHINILCTLSIHCPLLSHSSLLFLALLGIFASINTFTPNKKIVKNCFYSKYTYRILCTYVKYKKDKWDRTHNIYLSETGLTHLKWLSPVVSTFLQTRYLCSLWLKRFHCTIIYLWNTFFI